MNYKTYTCCSNLTWTREVIGSKGDKYTITYDPGMNQRHDYTCTCLGYVNHGNCYHIPKAQKERCAWNEVMEPIYLHNMKYCPSCGGPVREVSVTV